MEINYIISYLACFVVLCVFLIECYMKSFIMDIIKEVYRRKTQSGKTLQILFEEINTVIDNEFTFAVKLPYTTLDFAMVTDMKQSVDFIAKRVKESFTPDVIICFENNGISKYYLGRYIVRRIELQLINFMQNNNLKANQKKIE